jgi:hypothetical protein
MCDYRVNRIWIAACLVLMFGTGAAAIASGHTAPTRTAVTATSQPAAAPISGPADSGWD